MNEVSQNSHQFLQFEQLLDALRKVIHSSDSHSRRLAKTTGLTSPQLLLLSIVNLGENLTISEISKRMSLTQATVTTIIDRLEKRSLLVRKRCELDKRKIYIELTSQSIELLKTVKSSQDDDFFHNFEALSDWERGFLVSSLQRLASIMEN